MHYYQHHVSDFNNATRYLSRLERSIYRDLLDMYYEQESAIDGTDMQSLERRLLARSTDEQQALVFVLTEFFENQNGFYFNNRCESEIKKYQDKLETAIKAGKASAEARRKKARKKQRVEPDSASDIAEFNGRSTDVKQALNDGTTNQEPLTNNQEPLTNNQEPLTNTNDDGEKALNIPFDVFWKTYAKSVAKDKCEVKWEFLSDKVREQVMQHLPAYVASTPTKKFRKDPMTYLNKKGWLDDIIVDESSSNQQP
ncbi:MAG: YdaU family protein, partial [Psychrobacter sp.]